MSRIAVISIVFVCFFSELSIGQKLNKKATKETYKSLQSRSSVNEVSRLLGEADEIKITNPADALDKVEEALGMSLAQKDGFNEGKCYVILGEINEGIQEWKLALENYTRANQKLVTDYSESAERKRALQGLGSMNLKLNFIFK